MIAAPARSRLLPTAMPPNLAGMVTVSIDVEDWHQLVARRMTGEMPPASPHVETQVARVIDVLARHEAKATFFVLGAVAREKPDMVRRIAGAGHEIGSHGISHVPLHHLDRAVVRAELRDSRAMLSDITGNDVAGFRAPEFSIQAKNLWVLEEVRDAGYRYDSSIFPIQHRRYGIHDFPRGPVQVRWDDGSALWELPLATLPTRVRNVPVAGGGYFRLLPGVALSRAVAAIARQGDLAMLYFHPYEFAADELKLGRESLPADRPGRMKAAAWLALQALGRKRLPGKLERVLSTSRLVRAIDIVDTLDGAAAVHRPRTVEPQEYA